MKKITVSASRQYNVIMEKGALSQAGSYICDALCLADSSAVSGKKICIVTDTNVDGLYGQRNHRLWQSLEDCGFEVHKYVFPGGESHKTMNTIASLLENLAHNNFTRSDCLLALGGGITGDVTGFAAAAYLRGIEFIQVPTTLLAIVDSSVGGKTGVNLDAGKNLAGAFWQPSLVLFDPEVLSTLSRDFILDGIAETIKVGFIANPEILSLIHKLPMNQDTFTELAYLAVTVKRRIVEEDERETGKRQLLNLGHTVAHAIEKCSNYSISHGHAVAMGMDIVAKAAAKLGWCDKKCQSAMISALEKFGFPLTCPFTPAELASAALHDKKRRGDTLTLVIPESPGKCVLKTVAVGKLEEFIAAGMEAL